ncbi:hypothetical protein [Marispirochaeta aestuarii]|uniref:hypothetical protein n=1 Tax=Marispirochaeta aestuarii TaxID=1963862 RepID=UPI0029C8876D|nr:hypothetical protein [Marispirochaeta aestuarii]
MKSREELFVSLCLSPWSLGLKQVLRGEGPLGGMLSRAERTVELYPFPAAPAVQLPAWCYWLLDGCCGNGREPEIGKDTKALMLDCSLARVRLFKPFRRSSTGSDPGNLKGAGKGIIRIDGEELIRLLIAPGSEGSLGIRRRDAYVPWVFPEGDGLHYYNSENESGILSSSLIDEALNFADAVVKVILEYGMQ